MKSVSKKLTTPSNEVSLILLFIVFGSLLMISPKWNIGIFVFIMYAASLRFFRNVKLKKGILLLWFVTWAGNIIANLGVMPFPVPVSVIVYAKEGIFFLLPFIIDKLLYKRIDKRFAVFIFPTAALLLNYYIASTPRGTFGNHAYTMVDFGALMQIVSVTGIWGILFLIFLFASISNFIIENPSTRMAKKLSIVYVSLFLFSVTFGATRQVVGSKKLKYADTIKIAAVTSENSKWQSKIHEIVSGEKIEIPKTVGIASEEMMKAQASLVEMISDHNNPKFDSVYFFQETRAKEIFNDCKRAVNMGAQAILLSEGEFITFGDKEEHLIDEAKNFARENNIYFFFALASIHPEKLVQNEAFIENKILTINPEGEIIDTYFKAKPISGAEPSIAGDGIIEPVKISSANLSPIICFDADFPGLIRQTGQNTTDIILVATGDWYSISPYHSKIGAVRSIENGVSMLKTVSNGLSVSIDSYGRFIKEDDFFEDADHVMISEVPILKLNTIYSKTGDILVLFAAIYLLSLAVWLIIKRPKFQKNKTDY